MDLSRAVRRGKGTRGTALQVRPAEHLSGDPQPVYRNGGGVRATDSRADEAQRAGDSGTLRGPGLRTELVTFPAKYGGLVRAVLTKEMEKLKHAIEHGDYPDWVMENDQVGVLIVALIGPHGE